jgi:hypothetical protein
MIFEFKLLKISFANSYREDKMADQRKSVITLQTTSSG